MAGTFEFPFDYAQGCANQAQAPDTLLLIPEGIPFGNEHFRRAFRKTLLPGAKLIPSDWVLQGSPIVPHTRKEYSPWPHVLCFGSPHLLLS